MANPENFHFLAQTASEIDEASLKLTYVNEYIKAQESLANKLKEDNQRRKEALSSKKSENFRLKVEISNAEAQLEHLRVTYKTINDKNTEMIKEELLIKERIDYLTERNKKGEKEFEEFWTKCKQRYESIPLVKNLTSNKNRCSELKNEIDVLENEAKKIKEAIRAKKEDIKDKDRKEIVKLAEYIIRDRPAAVKIIKEKSARIRQLNKEIDEVAKETEAKDAKVINENAVKVPEAKNTKTTKDTWTIDDTLMIPRLQLPSVDMDLCVKLDINKANQSISPLKRNTFLREQEKIVEKKKKTGEMLKNNYIACYFDTTEEDDTDKEDSTINYSKNKLINIIEDKKINDSETYKLIANTNVDKFHEVNVITASLKAQEFIKSAKNSQTMEIEEVKEVEVLSCKEMEVLNPPTQFMDSSQDKLSKSPYAAQAEIHVETTKTAGPTLKSSQSSKVSQEDRKKKVSFDLAASLDVSDATLETGKAEEETPNVTVTSQLDLSDVTDDNYMAIKDMIIKKKQQLDLSPQFMYAENKLQKRNEEQIIKSKFFETNKSSHEDDNTTTNENKDNNNEKDQNKEQQEAQVLVQKSPEPNIVSRDVDNAVSSPNANIPDNHVTGLLYKHGPQGIIDLNISMSTTGCEDGDPDYPTYLDSSLLMSPKAEEEPPMSGNSEIGSQELPFPFLAGFRKAAGLSFFKQKPADGNPETSAQNSENNFNFKFGSDDKKSKGLFSFFRN